MSDVLIASSRQVRRKSSPTFKNGAALACDNGIENKPAIFELLVCNYMAIIYLVTRRREGSGGIN